MSLLFSMLPFYLLGNFHCIGMCGPLVMLLGQHRWRACYFMGRLTSFTLAGLAAGTLGSVIHIVLKRYHIPAAASFLFGAIILLLGIYNLLGKHYPGHQAISKLFGKVNNSLALLLLKDQPLPTFMFGFFTLALPCGQTLIVYTACALAGDPFTGLLNGFAFALLTSPALWFAMGMHRLIGNFKRHYNSIMGVSAICIGLLAFCRGLAELELIPHLTLNEETSSHFHLVIY